MPNYSFIVPIYNVEEYVEECISSLLSQTYLDFEIVVVDDGSKDKSYEKCLRLADTDSRVRIIRQQNMGLGEARNTGIRNASGKYLIFVDSDDFWISNDCLYEINRMIDKLACDVICYRLNTFDNTTKKFINNKYRKLRKINSLPYDKRISKMIANDMLSGSACNKVINKDIIVDNNLYFNKGLSEDIDWTLRLITFTQNIFFIDKPIYAYRKNRANSITDKVQRNFLTGWCTILDRMTKFLISNRIIKYDYIKRYVALTYRSLIINYIKSDSYDEEVRNKIIEYKGLIKYLTGLKMVVFKVANFFSLNLFLRLFKK